MKSTSSRVKLIIGEKNDVIYIAKVKYVSKSSKNRFEKIWSFLFTVMTICRPENRVNRGRSLNTGIDFSISGS